MKLTQRCRKLIEQIGKYIIDIIGCQKSLAIFLLNFQLFIKLVTILRFKSNMRRFVR